MEDNPGMLCGTLVFRDRPEEQEQTAKWTKEQKSARESGNQESATAQRLEEERVGKCAKCC